MRYCSSLIMTLVVLAGCQDRPLEPEPPERLAASVSPHEFPPGVVEGYIVVLRRPSGPPAHIAETLAHREGGSLDRVWSSALSGFFLRNVGPEAVERLRKHPAVLAIEPNALAAQSATQSLPAGGGEWALDRVDSRSLAYDQAYTYFEAGAGAHVYVLDTGINDEHVEFQGRIGNGVTHLSNSWGASPYIDQDGHGTAVASRAVGATTGIAKQATVHSVRINDNGNAQNVDLVDGLNWVAANAIQPAVAVMSYGAHATSIGLAMKGVNDAGVVMVTSAGNETADACSQYGNTIPSILVVSSSDLGDTKPSAANFGTCVDIFAPGVGVPVARHDDNVEFGFSSGTSFAAPFAAGLAAVVRAGSPIYLETSEVIDVLTGEATQGVLNQIGSGSPNLLLYSRYGAVDLGGPSTVESGVSSTQATWYAWANGGNGAWTFTWEASVDGGAFQIVGTAASYTRSIAAFADYDLVLRVTATSMGESWVNELAVDVEYVADCSNPMVIC